MCLHGLRTPGEVAAEDDQVVLFPAELVENRREGGCVAVDVREDGDALRAPHVRRSTRLNTALVRPVRG